MSLLNRLIAFFIGSSIPTLCVITVWLVTFMSFDLFDVLHNGVFVMICVIGSISWGAFVFLAPKGEFDEMVKDILG